MLNFDRFPIECRYDDGTIEQMSLQDLEQAFTRASTMLFDNEFRHWEQCMWSAIARVRNKPSKASLQSVVNSLEDYKRNLGRQYAAQHNMRVLLKYNEVERDIRWLVGQYELDRKSKPYFLGPKY